MQFTLMATETGIQLPVEFIIDQIINENICDRL